MQWRDLRPPVLCSPVHQCTRASVHQCVSELNQCTSYRHTRECSAHQCTRASVHQCFSAVEPVHQIPAHQRVLRPPAHQSTSVPMHQYSWISAVGPGHGKWQREFEDSERRMRICGAPVLPSAWPGSEGSHKRDFPGDDEQSGEGGLAPPCHRPPPCC